MFEQIPLQRVKIMQSMLCSAEYFSAAIA